MTGDPISLFERLGGEAKLREIVDTFIDTPMREPRYIRRLAKIRDLE